MKEADIRPQSLFNKYLSLAREDASRLLKAQNGFAAVACPACDTVKSSESFEKIGFRYAVCADCETLYTSPRPSVGQLAAFYRDALSVKFWGTDFFRETAEARRTSMFRPRAELLASLCSGRERRNGQYVDVGSGYGILLEEVRQLDAFEEVIGLEPGPELAEICRNRGFRVLEKSAEDVQPGDCHADAATAFEVLEHVFEPLSFLQGVRRLLNPQGKLLLTTLTVTGFDIQTLWESSKSVHPPHHLNLISVRGMEILFERAGFRVNDITTPGLLDVDIVSNAVRENPSITPPRFVREMLKPENHNARDAFQRFLSENRLSSHIRVIATA
ncbi:MAG: class I SAM-dependent methyltransferase [Gemmatimonadota bacterium]|nr:class I SAM-dependent methyltransferase [Gemmatimonadota bacterium]